MKLAKFSNVARSFLSTASSKHTSLTPKVMENDKIVYADIGGTGERKGIIRDNLEHIELLIFEPGSSPKAIDGVTIYKTGLWSGNAKLKLNILRNHEASTVYQINEDLMSRYGIGILHDKIKQAEIDVHSLDHIVSAPPDFIKIDVEGAEFEILRGSKESLKSCLGIFVEISFKSRYIDAPKYFDTMKLIENAGFEMYDIYPEYWKRATRFSDQNTNHEIAWANVLYLRPGEDVIAMMRDQKANAVSIARKYLLILKMYQFNSSALAFLQEARSESLVSEEFLAIAENWLNKSGGSYTQYLRWFLVGTLIQILWPIAIFHSPMRVNLKILSTMLFGAVFHGITVRICSARYKGLVVSPNDPSSII